MFSWQPNDYCLANQRADIRMGNVFHFFLLGKGKIKMKQNKACLVGRLKFLDHESENLVGL